MNEKDAIIQKIISDAQDRAEKILSDANEKARLIWAEAQSESEKALIDCEKESDRAEKELIERKKTLARLEGRKILLGAKQKAVESAFENALSALLKAPDGEYETTSFRSESGYGFAYLFKFGNGGIYAFRNAFS